MSTAISWPKTFLFLILVCTLVVVLRLSTIVRSHSAVSNIHNDHDAIRKVSSKYKFALINGGSVFFEPARVGWENECETFSDAQCDYFQSNQSNFQDCGQSQKQWLAEFAQNKRDGVEPIYDGIAIAPCDTQAIPPYVQDAVGSGISVVTLDADLSEESGRSAYIGTDNYFMGRTLATVLKQLRPEGGTFGFVSTKKSNLLERERGFRDEIFVDSDNRNGVTRWFEVEGSPMIFKLRTNMSEAQPVVDATEPDAIVTLYQSAMRDPNWTDFVDHNRHLNITYVGTDDSDFQIAYLHRHYVNGLVGQLPYDMGAKSLQTLYKKATGKTLDKDFKPTNLVSHTLVPVELPELNVDNNLLDNLKYAGFALFGIIVILAVLCIVWTLRYRNTMVVRAAQPFFLIMVAGGVIIMSSTLIPLSFDDGGDPDSVTYEYSVGICMSIPWLAFTGFTVIFSALFSKTWRVNRLFHEKTHYGHIQVTKIDVMAPFCVLLTSNFAALICWTLLDPLTYVRKENDGTDIWNRVISTYGACRSDDVLPYIIPLTVINFLAVMIASWQAYEAKDIKSEFAEAKYIGLAVSSVIQAFLTGLPILVIVRDEPQGFYVIMVLMLFLLSLAILVLIFFPKIKIQRQYAKMSQESQRKSLEESVRTSAGIANHANDPSAKSKRKHSSGHSLGGSASTHSVHSAASGATPPQHECYSNGSFQPGQLHSVAESAEEEGMEDLLGEADLPHESDCDVTEDHTVSPHVSSVEEVSVIEDSDGDDAVTAAHDAGTQEEPQTPLQNDESNAEATSDSAEQQPPSQLQSAPANESADTNV